ncbi:MAG TPA: DUF2589 domain-containing protein [Candidatus Scatomorpha pullistercoris]|uniref:DUF2589 domain-containing protein n=1 Tax=Candidatus Scatomorpha pullistercoris TaxID=2840929 RepID=A0A9D1G6Z4_9FIRM|nr:DUF2589 domain-containing protein [Candidatus Scatomorpha pullistercoris]
MAISDNFTGLPIGLLICQPLIEVAKGQAELCNVYLDQLFRLAFKTMPNLENGEAVETRTVKFKLNRMVVDATSGDTKPVTVEVEAPLLALVPVPAFTMEEATVNFTMEVKDSTSDKLTQSDESTLQSSLSAWGFSTTISGKVTTSRENTRTSDKTAKYDIYARAAQQPAAEGMAKLSSIFASVIEPITTSGSTGT